MWPSNCNYLHFETNIFISLKEILETQEGGGGMKTGKEATRNWHKYRVHPTSEKLYYTPYFIISPVSTSRTE